MKKTSFAFVPLALCALALPASAATLVVLNKSEQSASLIVPETGKTIATLNVGKGPAGIVFSPDGRRGFFAVSGANQVAVIDVAARKVIRNYDTDVEPDGIAWAR